MVTSSNLQERKQRELEQRRKDILKVVRKMVAKSGAREITMRKVAEESGFSNTVVYALFGDKASMIANAVDDDLIRLNKLMQAAVLPAKSPIERIRLACLAYVEYGLKHPDQYFLVFMERRPAAPVETSTLTFGDIENDPYAFVCSLTAELVRDGYMAADDKQVAVATQILWEGMHGMTSLRVSTGDDPWIERLEAEAHLNLLLDILLSGIVQRFPGAKSAAAIKLLSQGRS
ncbi:AcrR family transcriptional regulator [Variovorax boronicumulans]|uniref:TetR/AcrR family transcriptional regulator n=1 Tax=Variovorax boronicumulans TaxID=436515 RepID=UPI0027892691|nr:TetR/AcrR family transcriptional regulator [Variovorax boronicumulans]MDQ0016966.1 AcrR family transcriptional regulator [Variovorax boronicumulans]